MTIEEFADRFLAGRIGFHRPLDAQTNKSFLEFINALDPFIPADTYAWSSNSFAGYCFKGSSYKFFNRLTDHCSGNTHAPDDILIINYESILKHMSNAGKDLNELLNGFVT